MRGKLIVGIAGLAAVILTAAALIWLRTRRAEIPVSVAPAGVHPGLRDTLPPAEPPLALIAVTRPVTISTYFQYLDGLVRQYDSLAPYPLSEYLLVRANPWLIDTLENTDYYRQMARGVFVYDQRRMTVLKPGDTLRLPGPQTAAALLDRIANTRLDVNIPAFQLRIVEYDSVLFTFPVRVGKNEKKYLQMAHGTVDLRTRTGTGEIVRVNRNPAFYKPATGERYYYTKRDDGKTTWMPTIPWIEPSIDGRRLGQMIHPTTNPETLGKAASHGCIGLKEADAWRVYYYAPPGTRVIIRYDLTEVTPGGDTLYYKDIYRHQSGKKPATQAGLLLLPDFGTRCVCDP